MCPALPAAWLAQQQLIRYSSWGPRPCTKTKHSQQAKIEYKLRPFMGITDKTARFQQQIQQQQHTTGLQSHQSLQRSAVTWLNQFSPTVCVAKHVTEWAQPVDRVAALLRQNRSTYQSINLHHLRCYGNE
ncbi:protein TANC1 [Lates japonicus]|uniref:Protein TANC1 n=1 Tax=Lates japonicus TaxID=270547 RepID=A0AAD3R1M1_LATJO|nr:protein TANC1 [Lates japonicus]